MHTAGLVALAVTLASSQSAFAWFRLPCGSPLVSGTLEKGFTYNVKPEFLEQNVSTPSLAPESLPPTMFTPFMELLVRFLPNI